MGVTLGGPQRLHGCEQVGRAGRDGAEATAHAYLLEGDYLRLRSLAHSDLVMGPSVKAFLQKVFSGTTVHS